MENSNNKFEVSDKKIVRLDQDSKYSSGNATETKDRAIELFNSLQKFMDDLQGKSCLLFHKVMRHVYYKMVKVYKFNSNG